MWPFKKKNNELEKEKPEPILYETLRIRMIGDRGYWYQSYQLTEDENAYTVIDWEGKHIHPKRNVIYFATSKEPYISPW